MQQLLNVWANLDPRRRIIAIMSTVAMFAAVLMLSKMAASPNMGLLYSGLDAASAGEVVEALEQRSIPHEVRGGAIYVDRNERDRLRMTLAGEGLPANGSAGYELLDSMSGFGTTSQMFDAAYWRAKEGELARTILSSPHIRAARVHIANNSGQPFRRDSTPTAAVTVKTSGGPLSATQAKALKYLVASSVQGMLPDNVAVIDDATGLVMGTDEPAPAVAGDDRAEALRRNVERLLTARMGPGRAVVEVSVETVTDRESIIEKRFDPDSRVAISTEVEERTLTSADQGGGAVTVASNLPTGEAGGGRSASSNESETRERTNFEVSETQREILRGPGAIKRISVAVMLDGVRTTDADGNVDWAPLPESELAALEELVKSTIGFDAARGDTVVLKSMPLTVAENAGTLAEENWITTDSLDVMTLAQLGVLAVVVLILGLFVVRPVFAGRTARVERMAEPARIADGAVATPVLSGEIADNTLPKLAMNVVGNMESALDSGTVTDSRPSDPVERLRQIIDDRREETFQILQQWMEDEEEPA